MRPRFPISLLIIVALLAVFLFIGFLNEWDLSFFSNPLFWAVMILVPFLLLIYNAIGDLVESERYKQLSTEEQEEYLEKKNTPFLTRLYDSAFGQQPVKQETDILLNHDYDGIKELDNKLPQWWLALFYFGVFFLVFYMTAFSFSDFAHPDVELTNFNIRHDREVDEYKATVPQPKPEDMVYNASNIEGGKKIFEAKCVQCHNADGAATGNAGANLTDDYWRNINKEDLFANIVSVVWDGSAYDKTMIGWGAKDKISGIDVEKVAAYVKFLNEDEDVPNGKEPLGLVVKQWAQDPLPSDPTKVVDIFTYFGDSGEGDKAAADSITTGPAAQ